jgi:trehalose 2-sulfotransferase
MNQQIAPAQKAIIAKSAYVICTAPRTGSSLLAEALASTGQAGRPKEYFDIHKHNEQHWINQLKIPRKEDYLDRVIAAGTTPNGVFGLKLHWHQLPALASKFASAAGSQIVPGTKIAPAQVMLDELLQGRFPAVHYLWLRRRNKVAQGISYYRASRSDIWRVGREGEAGASSAKTDVPFDFAEIDRFVKMVEKFDRGWYDFFMGKKIRALLLFYEDFVASYDQTIRAICKYIEVSDNAIPIRQHAFRKQADSLSSQWEQEYQRLKKATADVPPQTRFLRFGNGFGETRAPLEEALR